MRFLRTSFTARLITYFLLISLLGSLVTTTAVYLLARATLTQAVYERLDSVATLKEDALNRWVDNEMDEMLIIAHLSEIRTPLRLMAENPPESPLYQEGYRALHELLEAYLATDAENEEAFIMAPVGGEVWVSTNPESEGTYRTTDTYYVQGRRSTYIQNFYPSPQTGKTTLTLSTPILDENNQLLGVLAIHLSLDTLDTILQERTGLGATGETYLVDQYNNFISAARYGLRTFPRGVHTTGIDAALSGQNGTALYVNYNDTPVIGAYRWLPGREVALLVEISQEEAFAPARRLARTSFLLSGLVLLLLSIGVYAIARQIATPILAISDAASRVAEGQLAARAQVTAQDEVGTLARNFNQMAHRLQELIAGLEQRVAERTQALERRATQLQTAAEVGTVAASIRDLDTLLDRITHLISQRFGFYHVGIFLLDETGEYAVLQASNSPGGQRMLQRGHRLKVGEQGIVGYVTARGEGRIALDVGEDAVFFDNPDLPETRSEMALPLIAGGRILGALDVQSTEEAAFTDEDVQTLQVLANQIAIAIENSFLFQETQEALDALQRTYAQTTAQAWNAILRSYRQQGYRIANGRIQPLREADWSPTVLKALRAGQVILDEDDPTLLLVPIRIRAQTVGLLRLKKAARSGPWDEEEIDLAQTLADELAISLDSARLYQESVLRATQERTIGDVAARLQEALDLNTILRTAAEETQRALGLPEVLIQLIEPQNPPPAPEE